MIIAAFEPFGGRRRNRSWEVLERFPPHSGIEQVRLPVDFARLPEEIEALLSERPTALLLLGESSDRIVRVEQIALNLADSDLPDNAGARPRMEPLMVSAPLALQATWSARAVADRIAADGVPAAPSFHAGTFACNAAFFLALLGARDRQGEVVDAPIPVGLLHIPRFCGLLGPSRISLARAIERAAMALLAPPRTSEVGATRR